MGVSRRALFTTIIAIGFIATYALTHAAANAPAPPLPGLVRLPLEIGGWAGVDAPPLKPADAKVLAADAYVHRYYEGPAGAVEMDAAYYSQRRVGASMHSPLNCLPGNGWTVADMRSLPVETSEGTWNVRELTVRRRNTIYALAYWYQNGERILTGEASTRFQLLADSLRQRRADVGLVRVMTPLSSETAAEREAVASFAALLMPELWKRWN